MTKPVKKFEIYYADLTPVKGSEQGGVRPVLIIQNNIGNKFSPTTIACVVTAKTDKPAMPTHIYLGKNFGLPKESLAMLEQVRTIDKLRLKEKIGTIDDPNIMAAIDQAIGISFDI